MTHTRVREYVRTHPHLFGFYAWKRRMWSLENAQQSYVSNDSTCGEAYRDEHGEYMEKPSPMRMECGSLVNS